MLYWLADKLLIGYIYSTILFLFLRIFDRTARERSASYLNVANAIILISLVLHLIYQIVILFECRTSQSKISRHIGIYLYPMYDLNCYTSVFYTIILGFAFQLCFLFRKCRINIWLTAISVALLLIFTNLDSIMLAITSLYRDYISSSWAIYDTTKGTIGRTISVAVYFLVCWRMSQPRAIKLLSEID